MAEPDTAWFSISKWKSGEKCENSIIELKLSDTIEDVVSRVHGNDSSEIAKVWVGANSDTERVVVTPTASLRMLRRQFNISYIMLNIDEGRHAPEPTDNPGGRPGGNILATMMRQRSTENDLPPKKGGENTSNIARMYNALLGKLEGLNVGFRSDQVDTLGKRVIDTICNALWYLDPHHQKFRDRGIQLLGDTFSTLCDYVDYKASHKRRPMVCLSMTLLYKLGQPGPYSVSKQ